MKIFIDPGHGGTDPGAVSGNLCEKNMTLITAKQAEKFLKQNGQRVTLSRNIDTTLSLSERADLANRWGADVFISLHYNAGGGNRGEVIHSVYGEKGKNLAEKIASHIKNLGQETVRIYSKASKNGGDYFTVIAKTYMPAVIVEPCFIDSEDKSLANTEEKQKKIGIAVAKGVLDYFGARYKEDKYMELTEVNDIVYELKARGIITETDVWLKKLSEDNNAYWLAKKTVDYIRKAGV